MKSKYWYDTNEDGDRKRRRQAEFLVHNYLNWKYIYYIGVELLATTHWVIKDNLEINYDHNKVVEAVKKWSIRKKRLFKENHIISAWKHLNNQGLFN